MESRGNKKEGYMFKYLLAIVLSLALITPCYAEQSNIIAEWLQTFSIGTMYDFNSNQWLGLAYISPIKKNNFTGDIGYFKDLDNLQESNISGIYLGIGYDVKDIKIPKVEKPILHLSLGAGIEPNENLDKDNWHYGITAGLKF